MIHSECQITIVNTHEFSDRFNKQQLTQHPALASFLEQFWHRFPQMIHDRHDRSELLTL